MIEQENTDIGTESPGALQWFYDELKTRRVLSAVAIYLGVAWGAIEAGQFFIGYFSLGGAALRILVLTAIFGLPTTIVLAWYHGAPGSQYVTTREIVLVGSLVAIWFLFIILPGNGPVNGPGLPSPPSNSALGNSKLSSSTVAVLYWQNLSSNHKLNWISAGFADAISSTLASRGSLKVLARNRIASYRSSRPVDPTIVARELECGRVVTGSYQVAQDMLRLSCQVIDGSSGRALAAFKTDGKLESIFSLQDELAMRLAQFFTGQNVKSEKRKRSSFAAYRAYCEALTAIDDGKMYEAADGLRKALEGGMVYSPALDELLRQDMATTYLGQDGSQVEESLFREKNYSKEPWTEYFTRGTMKLLSAKAADGTSLPFRLAGTDSGLNNDYYVTLPTPLSPSATVLLWIKYKLYLLSVDTGIAHRYYVPKVISYNGPARRAIQTIVLPVGEEPLLIYPEPKTLFQRDNRWHVGFARRLGEDVYLEADIFYSSKREVLERADEAIEYSANLLFSKKQLARKGAQVICWNPKPNSFQFGDIISSYDNTKITTAEDLWRFSRHGDGKGRQMVLLRGNEEMTIQVAPNHIPYSLADFPEEQEAHFALDNILLTRARIALSTGDFKRAQNVVSRLLSGEPRQEQRSLAYVRMAQALQSLGKKDEAQSFYKRAVNTLEKLESNSLLGVPKEIYDRPLAELNKSLSQRPDDFLAAFGVALKHFEKGSYHDAHRAMKRALALEPSARFNHRLAAKICFALGKSKEAGDYIAAFLENPPFEQDGILAEYLLANEAHYKAGVKVMCRHLRNYKRDSSNVFTMAIKKCCDRGDKTGLLALAKAFGKGNREARWVLNDQVYRFYRTWKYQNSAKSIAYALKVARLNSELFKDDGDFELEDSLGEMLYHSGKYDESRKVFEEILKGDASWHRAHLYIGCCLEKQSDFKNARQSFELALKGKSWIKEEAERRLDALPK